MKQCKVGMDQENIISTFASTQFYADPEDRKSTRQNSSHSRRSRMPSSA